MKVYVEMRSDLWPEVLAKIENLGFTGESGDPWPYCGASVITMGVVSERDREACLKVPGVIDIWEANLKVEEK